MTAREHIRYFGELHGLHGRRPRLAHRSADSPARPRRLADRRVAGFSQGERTKVALARALVHEPRNVILDEPTNGLDVMSTRAVRDLIRGLRDDGCCVLFSSHIMQEVSALCDRIIVIAQGTVVAQTARRTSSGGRPDAPISRTPSWRWPASAWRRRRHEARSGCHGRVSQGASSTVFATGGRFRRCCFSAIVDAAAVRRHVHGHRRTAEERRRDRAAGRRRPVRAGVRRLAVSSRPV